jgi:hypothetical protein
MISITLKAEALVEPMMNSIYGFYAVDATRINIIMV